MGEVDVVAGLLEQVGEPLPAVGRLERYVRPVGVAEQLPERIRVVDDPPRERKLPVLVNDRDLRAPAVQVDADQRVGLLTVGTSVSNCPAARAQSARSRSLQFGAEG